MPPDSTPAFSVVVTRRAAREIDAAASWWLSNRPKAPGAVRDELERAFSLLERQPLIGMHARSERLRGVRRILLSRVQYHRYYRINEDRREVEILAFWHARRGRDPSLESAG